MSDLGYSNKAQASLQICFNHLDSYADSLQQAIHTSHAAYEDIGVKVDGEYRQLNTNVLQIENEYYSDIRPKRVTQSGEKPVHALIKRGVEYIEVRNTDINPLLPLGMDLDQARFLNVFLISCLLGQADDLDEAECRMVAENHSRVVNRGREPGLKLLTPAGEVSREALGYQVLEKVAKTAALLDDAQGTDHYRRSVSLQRAKLEDSALTPSAQVLKALRESGMGYSEWVLAISSEHRANIEPLIDPAVKQSLLDEAARSLTEQAELEQAEQPPFDQFLADYVAR